MREKIDIMGLLPNKNAESVFSVIPLLTPEDSSALKSDLIASWPGGRNVWNKWI